MKTTLLKLANYNSWANAKIIGLLKTQAPNLIEKEIASSFNSIHKTILHMADAEYAWHCRLVNVPLTDIPTKTGKTIDCLKDTNQKLLEFVQSKEDKYFSESTAYKNMKGENFTNMNNSILLHVFNHGTFHRGQIVTIMRNAGFTGEIESTDFITFERL